MSIDPERLMNYQATFEQMASSMGVVSETTLQISNALTMIGADLASVGTWTLGEDGLARFLNITNSMLKDINWTKLRTSLSEFYKELAKLTILIFTSMLDLYAHFL